MNYSDMSRSYMQEADRLRNRISCVRKKQPMNYWQRLEQNYALELMDSMYLDCLLIGKYLKKRGVDPDETM